MNVIVNATPLINFASISRLDILMSYWMKKRQGILPNITD